jgi:hypothetical protein
MNGSSIVWFDDFADGSTWNPPTEDVVGVAISLRPPPRAQIVSDGLGLNNPQPATLVDPIRPVLSTQILSDRVNDGVDDMIRQRFSARPSAHVPPMVHLGVPVTTNPLQTVAWNHPNGRPSPGHVQSSPQPSPQLTALSGSAHRKEESDIRVPSDDVAYARRRDPSQDRALAERTASIYRPREDAAAPLGATVSFARHMASVASPLRMATKDEPAPVRATYDAAKSTLAVAAAGRLNRNGSSGSVVVQTVQTVAKSPWASDFETVLESRAVTHEPHANGFSVPLSRVSASAIRHPEDGWL